MLQIKTDIVEAFDLFPIVEFAVRYKEAIVVLEVGKVCFDLVTKRPTDSTGILTEEGKVGEGKYGQE